MTRVIVKIIGSTDFEIEQEFVNEEAAQEGLHPEKTDVKFYNTTKTKRRLFKNKVEEIKYD